MARRSSASSLGWASLAVLAGVQGVVAHEHHGDNIPEGQTISLEPIVGGIFGSEAG